MSRQTLQLTDKINDYLIAHSVNETSEQSALRLETKALPLASMQVAPEQAEYLKFLVTSHGFKSIIEVGTFTGYSALAMALALPDDGRIICCDINPTWQSYCERYWQAAKVDHKIDLKIAPATDTLSTLMENQKSQFDFMFIDADKTQYQTYYEMGLELIRPGGIIAIDNIFWDGKVVDENDMDRQTVAIRDMTAFVYQDNRVSSTILPIADGLLLAYKL